MAKLLNKEKFDIPYVDRCGNDCVVLKAVDLREECGRPMVLLYSKDGERNLVVLCSVDVNNESTEIIMQTGFFVDQIDTDLQKAEKFQIIPALAKRCNLDTQSFSKYVMDNLAI
jgi:hypothetical protein